MAPPMTAWLFLNVAFLGVVFWSPSAFIFLISVIVAVLAMAPPQPFVEILPSKILSEILNLMINEEAKQKLEDYILIRKLTNSK